MMADPVLKNNIDLASVIMGLIGDIYDITSKVYETLDKVMLYDDDEATLFVLGRYTYSGQKMKDFHNKLNYSAMVVDYGLAEVFSGFLLLTGCLQSSSINLGSRGQLSLSAQEIVMPSSVKESSLATPTLVVQEGMYIAKMILASGEILALGTKAVFGGIQLGKEAKEELKAEAL
jgi:hypothetical protein